MPEMNAAQVGSEGAPNMAKFMKWKLNEHEPSKFGIPCFQTTNKKADFAMTKSNHINPNPRWGWRIPVNESNGESRCPLLAAPKSPRRSTAVLHPRPWFSARSMDFRVFLGGKPMETPANLPVHVPIFDIVSVKIC
jgi:hypothetical protein